MDEHAFQKQIELPTDAGDPVDGNPFPPDNPRHDVWKQATLRPRNNGVA
jgi:hypothetical protein